VPDEGDLPEETERPDPDGTAPLDPVEPLTPDDLGPEGRTITLSSESIGLVAIVVIGLVMAGFILGRLTAPDDGEGSTEDTAPAAQGLDFPTGDADRTGYWSFGGVTVALVDPFDRPDDPRSLGAASNGAVWDAVAGRWGVEGNRAVGSAAGRPAA
jgi:hypothetical protein